MKLLIVQYADIMKSVLSGSD